MFFLKLYLSIRGKLKPNVKDLEQALLHYQGCELELCLRSLREYFKTVSVKKAKRFTPGDSEKGLAIHEMLFNLEFNDYREGTPERILYSRTFLYLIENASPDLQAELNANLERMLLLKPTGYTESGEPCFAAEDIADVFNISIDKASDLIDSGKLKERRYKKCGQ